jgi:hypothetical protein
VPSSPGASSLLGLFFEVSYELAYSLVKLIIFHQNGPIQIQGDYSASPNKYSWDKLADYFWVDQPVCVAHCPEAVPCIDFYQWSWVLDCGLGGLWQVFCPDPLFTDNNLFLIVALDEEQIGKDFVS